MIVFQLIIMIIFLILSINPINADIIIDGTTATTVSINANGATLIGIAPKDINSISHNRYDEFSVNSHGVKLDNSDIFARTIINEVTSNKRSILAGKIEILGLNANLIIANPNGITANGVEFINTSGVVLGAGSIEYKNYGNSPLTRRANAILNTRGDINIKDAGVFGNIVSLQLLANKIKIDGILSNNKIMNFANHIPDIKIIAGHNKFEFDSSSMPVNASQQWVSKITNNNVANDNSNIDEVILVDITLNGKITAGQIAIEVTSNGAGVSYAGTSMANIGNFDILAMGDIEIKSGNISSKQHIKINAQQIAVISNKTNNNQIKIEAFNGSVYMNANAGDINITDALIYGEKSNDSNITIKGGVHLKANNDIILTSRDPKKLAILFSSNGDTYLEAKNNIINNTGRIISNGKTTLKAGNKIANITNVITNENTGIKKIFYRKKKRLWYSLWQLKRKETGFKIKYATPVIENQLGYIIGDSIDLKADIIENIGGEINANDGDITAKSKIFLTEGVMIGEATFTRRCGVFICNSTGRSNVKLLSGIMNASNNINIYAAESFANNGGEVNAYNNLRINSPKIETIAKKIPVLISRPGGLFHLFGRHTWMYEENLGGKIAANFGNLYFKTTQPIRVTAGLISWGKKLYSDYQIEEIYKKPVLNQVGKYQMNVLWGVLP